MIISKRIKILIIINTILIIVAVTLLILNRNKKSMAPVFRPPTVEIMTDAEKNELNLYHLGIYEVGSRDENGKVETYKFVKLAEPKPINVEIMTTAEKVKIGVATRNKIQILQRDDKGNVISYRLIKDDADVIDRY